MEIPFLKKLETPKFTFTLMKKRPSYVGIDIGSFSVKVVELRQDKDRAVLESYGELKTERYFKKKEESPILGGGFLRFLESDVAEMVKDVIKESAIKTDKAVFAVPASAALIVLVNFPRLSEEEIKSAIPFESRKYIPIPQSEVFLDWEIIDEGDEKRVKVLIVAIPKEIINKFKRIASLAGLEVTALEVENFSLARSLLGQNSAVSAIISIGAQYTSVTIVDAGIIRSSHNIEQGSNEITVTLAKSLSVDNERAEEFKKTVGLSDRPEEKEIAEIIFPIVDTLFREVLRVINQYNKGSEQKVERLILTGGGSNLSGIIDYTAKTIGLETLKGNPFSKIIYPVVMQPILRDIGTDFAVAVGLALRQVMAK